MDITNIVSDDYVEFPPETRVSKLASTFENPTVKGSTFVWSMSDATFSGSARNSSAFTSMITQFSRLRLLCFEVKTAQSEASLLVGRSPAQHLLESVAENIVRRVPVPVAAIR